MHRAVTTGLHGGMNPQHVVSQSLLLLEAPPSHLGPVQALCSHHLALKHCLLSLPGAVPWGVSLAPRVLARLQDQQAHALPRSKATYPRGRPSPDSGGTSNNWSGFPHPRSTSTRSPVTRPRGYSEVLLCPPEHDFILAVLPSRWVLQVTKGVAVKHVLGSPQQCWEGEVGVIASTWTRGCLARGRHPL